MKYVVELINGNYSNIGYEKELIICDNLEDAKKCMNELVDEYVKEQAADNDVSEADIRNDLQFDNCVNDAIAGVFDAADDNWAINIYQAKSYKGN